MVKAKSQIKLPKPFTSGGRVRRYNSISGKKGPKRTSELSPQRINDMSVFFKRARSAIWSEARV